MRRLFYPALFTGWLLCATPLGAQQVCPGLPYVANTPEDELMQAVNGAENPQEQIAALDKFAQAHPDSRFIPCVEEYYTIAYLKLGDYAKLIEHAEKGLSGNYRDLMLIMNTARGYLASGTVSDKVFDIVLEAPDQIKAETNPPRPPKVSDAEWQKNLQDLAEQANEWRAYMASSFFQLLQRVPDGNKRLELIGRFEKAFPDAETKEAGPVNFNYYLAYKLANQPAKAVEYGEKAIASDPNNVAAYNLVAYDYGIGRTDPDKAADYAKKVMALAQAMKKPEGVPDDQFKKDQNNQLGMAHLTLGYVAFLKGAKTHKVAPAIEEFQTAADLLKENPELEGQTLYYLAYAYEQTYPANHRAAMEALERASSLQSSWQGQARDLLAKIKRVAH